MNRTAFGSFSYAAHWLSGADDLGAVAITLSIAAARPHPARSAAYVGADASPGALGNEHPATSQASVSRAAFGCRVSSRAMGLDQFRQVQELECGAHSVTHRTAV